MKLKKTASGKKTLVISKSDWLRIGKKKGWLNKLAENAQQVRDIILKWQGKSPRGGKLNDHEFLETIKNLLDSNYSGISEHVVNSLAMTLQEWASNGERANPQVDSAYAQKVHEILWEGESSGRPHENAMEQTPQEQADVDGVEVFPGGVPQKVPA